MLDGHAVAALRSEMTGLKDADSFLTPEGPFLTAWLWIIVLVPLTVMGWVYREARDTSWAANWRRALADADEPEAQWANDRGSIEEISHAVATAPEAIAEAMPGLLLTFGLLGTFLGLGLALDKAAGLIHSAAESTASGNLPDLHDVIDKIGAKFKTSTWGLIGFLLFRWWLIASAFDRKRFDWCANRLRAIQHRRKEAATKQEKHDREVNEQTLKAVQGMRGSMDAFLAANVETIDTMMRSSKGMAVAAERVGTSAGALSVVVQGLDRNVASVLGQIKTDLTEVIGAMKSSFDQSLTTMSRDLNDATSQISNSVTSLSTAVTGTMTNVKESIQKSVDTQSDAHQMFVLSSETLSVNVESMTDLVTNLCSNITLGLEAVSDSRQQVASLNKRYSNITENSGRSALAIEQLVTQMTLILTLLEDTLDALKGSLEPGVGAGNRSRRPSSTDGVGSDRPAGGQAGSPGGLDATPGRLPRDGRTPPDGCLPPT